MSRLDDFQEFMEWCWISPFRGGRVVAAAGDDENRNVFRAEAYAGGVCKTADAGTYWEHVSESFCYDAIDERQLSASRTLE